jgi:hypothetical protein
MNPRLRTPLRIAAWTTSGLLGLGIAAGAADAVVSHSSGTPVSSVAAANGGGQGQTGAGQTGAGQARARGQAEQAGIAGRFARLGALKRFEHGQATFQGKDSPVDVQAQRGAASNVSASGIEVTSADGFTQTYVIDSKTKIRKAKQQIAATAIPAQAQVLVVAYKENNAWVARRIVVLPDKGANSGAAPSDANPASTTST